MATSCNLQRKSGSSSPFIFIFIFFFAGPKKLTIHRLLFFWRVAGGVAIEPAFAQNHVKIENKMKLKTKQNKNNNNNKKNGKTADCKLQTRSPHVRPSPAETILTLACFRPPLKTVGASKFMFRKGTRK